MSIYIYISFRERQVHPGRYKVVGLEWRVGVLEHPGCIDIWSQGPLPLAEGYPETAGFPRAAV